MIESLEAGGTAVGPLVPWPLLAGPPEGADDAVTVWDAGGSLELIEHADGVPRGWWSTGRSADAAHPSPAAPRPHPRDAPRGSCCGPPTRPSPPHCGTCWAGEFAVDDSDGPTLSPRAAAAAAAAVLAGKADPPVDLRTGPLADPDPLRAVRGPLRLAAASLALALLLVTAALLWRAGRLETLAEWRQIAAEEVYRDLFPRHAGAGGGCVAGWRASGPPPPGCGGPPGPRPRPRTPPQRWPRSSPRFRRDDDPPAAGGRPAGLKADGRTCRGPCGNCPTWARLAAALRAAGLSVPPPRSRRSGREVAFDPAAERGAW